MVEVVFSQVLLADITLMKHCLRLALSALARGFVKTADVLLYVALLAGMACIASQEVASGSVGHVDYLTSWECTHRFGLSANLTLLHCFTLDANCRRTVETLDVLLFAARRARMARSTSQEEVLGGVGLVV